MHDALLTTLSRAVWDGEHTLAGAQPEWAAEDAAQHALNLVSIAPRDTNTQLFVMHDPDDFFCNVNSHRTTGA